MKWKTLQTNESLVVVIFLRIKIVLSKFFGISKPTEYFHNYLCTLNEAGSVYLRQFKIRT